MDNYQFVDVGHMAIYGETNSGKTYAAKHIIKLLKPKRVYVFTETPGQWNNEKRTKVYKENFEEECPLIVEKCNAKKDKEVPRTDKCNFIIVFDDYNTKVKNTKAYADLFTHVRHAGIRIINLAHIPTSIPPVARLNCRYVMIMSCFKSLKDLATIYYGGDTDALQSVLLDSAEKYGEFGFCFIDTRYIDRTICAIAPPRETQIVEVVPHESTAIAQGIMPNYPGLMPTTGSMNISKTSGADFHDHSVNNIAIQHKIKTSQFNENNQIHNEMKIINQEFNVTLERRRRVLEVRDLVYRPFLTLEEKISVTSTVNSCLRPSVPATVNTYDDYLEIFMSTYYPGDGYVKNTDRNVDLIAAAGSLYASQDNIFGIITVLSSWIPKR